jgi:hypothetical protein
MINKTMGLTKNRIYLIWRDMNRRCYNKKYKDYKYYGAKGIKVYKKWKDNFIEFLYWSHKHGYDNNMTIERIDAKKGYSPFNCKYITHYQNTINRNKPILLKHNGETKCMKDWSRLLFGNDYTVKQRIRQGWSAEKALTTSIKSNNKLKELKKK